VRTYLGGAEQAGLLALRQAADPQIGPALAALHARPAMNWTLADLAGLAGMSRTLLAARFRAAVGESPMRHLAKIRLGQAAGYLTTTGLSVEAIARRTGYGTNASLSKAFKPSSVPRLATTGRPREVWRSRRSEVPKPGLVPRIPRTNRAGPARAEPGRGSVQPGCSAAEPAAAVPGEGSPLGSMIVATRPIRPMNARTTMAIP
jgi:AraC-like DNA-binding protein